MTSRQSSLPAGILWGLATIAAGNAGDLPTVLDPEPLHDAKAVQYELPAVTAGGWRFSAGPVWRHLGAVSFDTGATTAMIPSVFGANSFTEPAGIGPDNAFADRTYDEGFVNIGAATAGTGLTTNWGYTTSVEQGDNLAFSRAGGERREIALDNAAALARWSDGADSEVGPYLELTYAIPVRDGLTIGAGITFMSTDISGSRGGLNTFTQNQTLDVYDVTAVDTYPLGGVIPPQAGYTGSYAGPGPLINNIPGNRQFPESLNNTQTATFMDSISENFDMDLHTIGLGGQIEWWPASRSFIRAGGGMAVNFADWSASRNERVMQSLNGTAATQYSQQQHTNSDNDILLGLYLQATAGWQINESWSLQTFGRYDWNESLESRVGNSSFDVDLDGWSAGIGAGYRF